MDYNVQRLGGDSNPQTSVLVPDDHCVKARASDELSSKNKNCVPELAKPDLKVKKNISATT
jgi:hypothetical protein